MTTLNWLALAIAGVLAMTSILTAVDAERRYRARQREGHLASTEPPWPRAERQLTASVVVRAGEASSAEVGVVLHPSAEAKRRLLSQAEFGRAYIRVNPTQLYSSPPEYSEHVKRPRLWRIFSRKRFAGGRTYAPDARSSVPITIEGLNVASEDLRAFWAEVSEDVESDSRAVRGEKDS
jgi:hypothetical protein